MSVGLGVGGVTIASGSRVHPSHSRTSRLLTSSLSLGVSGFVLSYNPVDARHVDSSTLAFSLSSHRPSFLSLAFSIHNKYNSVHFSTISSEQDNRLSPPQTLILNFTMTHTRYG